MSSFAIHNELRTILLTWCYGKLQLLVALLIIIATYCTTALFAVVISVANGMMMADHGLLVTLEHRR